MRRGFSIDGRYVCEAIATQKHRETLLNVPFLRNTTLNHIETAFERGGVGASALV